MASDRPVVGKYEHDHLEQIPAESGPITSTLGGSASCSRSNDTSTCLLADRCNSTI